MRPDMGAYGIKEVYTPNMDAFASAKGSTLFTRAYCQIAWCAPSRNSFLTGRRPDETKAWNFVDYFREKGIGQDWISFPQYFKEAGYHTTSLGKVFHPLLPPLQDYPKSWTDLPYIPTKPECPDSTMSCEFDDSSDFLDVDTLITDLAIKKLSTYTTKNQQEGFFQEKKGGDSKPFFLAVGYQSPRLPWSYPSSAASHYPPAKDIKIALHPESPGDDQHEHLEWFRQAEVNIYSDIHNITYTTPMTEELQQIARRAYYAAITHVDTQFGRLWDSLNSMNLTENTLVVFIADHGQNVGEHNMWSMMNVLESSLRVPMVIHLPGNQVGVPVYHYAVELVDVYPTTASLAGLPNPPFNLSGTDLSTGILTGEKVKEAAYGQITRCVDCSKSYPFSGSECKWGAEQDKNFSVACCKTPRDQFDYMGMSIRTETWRYTTWCGWNGTSLSADWANCTTTELFSHQNDESLFNVDDWENVNLAGDPKYSSVEKALLQQLQHSFSQP
eukprot:CAMPEP_0174275632 /NCGR_PEP_ID=MMETSP0439-20130205/59934_1 /TAXON_ID=0 /ORGANISM="Stereomyxa ramosa, Strain Chinc5" /LENGTH=498 /DNA_ID=CAMNT_0015367761 /DNA_START=46 /DNA_END=1538 /DNA_ORIENTATION=-